MVKAVFFDVGGVLLEQDPAVFPVYDREQGWLAGTSLGIWKAHLRIAHVGDQMSSIDHHNSVANIRQRLYSTNRVVQGVEKIVQELRTLYRVAVISNFTTDLDQVLDQLGLLTYFELIVNSSKVGAKKPDETIYKLACSLLQVKPAESVFVDDSHANVTAARQLGMKGIVFRTADRLRSELSELGLELAG